MKRQITFEWWLAVNSLGPEDCSDTYHARALEQIAEDWIFRKIKNGYIEGDLYAEMDDKYPTRYKGWWSYKEASNEKK